MHTTFFIHIQKSGGICLGDVFSRQFKPGQTVSLYNSHDEVRRYANSCSERNTNELFIRKKLTDLLIQRFTTISAAKKRRTRAVVGHFPFGLHSCLDHSASYVTMLRDPVSRIISWYDFVKAHPVYSIWVPPHLSLQEWIEQQHNMQFMNWQTRLLSGSLIGDMDTLLEQAKHNLVHFFPAIGLTECFDESLLLFRKILGWKDIHYRRLNTTSRAHKTTQKTNELQRCIETYNAHDRALYTFARQRFHELIEQQDTTSFKEELYAFQKQNQRIHVMLRLTIRMYYLMWHHYVYQTLRSTIKKCIVQSR